jgi:hypothetical protein
VLLSDFSTDSYLAALAELEGLGDVKQKCIETAHREFDLETVGGKRYRAIYTKLLEADQ